MAVDDAGARGVERRHAGELRLELPGLSAGNQRQILDAVAHALPADRLDFRQLRRVGRDDKLAAATVLDAVAGAILVQHAPAAHAVARAQRIGRIVHAGMDDLAVARGDAGADAMLGLRHDDVVAGTRRGARGREPDHAGADDEDLHLSRSDW